MVQIMENDVDYEELTEIEKLILLVLGKAGCRISVLHLQKLVFLLWRFHPIIRELVDFKPHEKGPYSQDISEALKNPTHYTDSWKYIEPISRIDRIVGGYAELTSQGREEYERIMEDLQTAIRNSDIVKKESALHLAAALDIIVPLYTKLEWDELLLLLYTTEKFKEYSKKSELSKNVISNYYDILMRLIEKRVIPQGKKELFIKRVEEATWI